MHCLDHFGQVTAHSSVYEVDADLDCCDAEQTGTDAFILSFVKNVWIGVVSVLPQDGCELLSAHRGAYVNFLTLAADEAEYRSKVASVLTHYRLELHGLENVRLFTLSDNPAEELNFN